MEPLLLLIVGAAAALILYTYVGYPALLRLGTVFRAPPSPPPQPSAGEEWPFISVSLPAHNEEASIGGALESLLAADYPPERRQILVVSDASTDRTDAIVAEYASRGVELLRLARRSGKNGAENAGRARLRGEIVINTDASVRVDARALKHLVARFADPSVGVASARDVSIAPSGDRSSAGEGRYVGYEMWVRELETRLGGIVGASGCCYAVRAAPHRQDVPPGASRDFAAVLLARQRGWRAVSVREAVCYVPRLTSLGREYRRKVRTVARGLATLWHQRSLLNPARYGAFAWMLLSHKLCRWMVPWALTAALIALSGLSVAHWWARGALGAALCGAALAAVGWSWPAGRPMPGLVALAAYALGGVLATLHAWLTALAGGGVPVWEPSRREPVDAGVAAAQR